MKKEAHLRVQDMHNAMKVIESKWIVPMLLLLRERELSDLTVRFKNMEVLACDGKAISPRSVSVSLQKLAEHKLVTRHVFAEVPPRVEYRLTDFGREVEARARALVEYITRYGA